MTKNFDPNNFRSQTITTKPHHYHWQKTLTFPLSSWQHFAGILPLSQWLCRKSTTWFLSRRMRIHFSPVNTGPGITTNACAFCFCLGVSRRSKLTEMDWENAAQGPAILVTNRWNRSHLSWIFSKFLTFTPDTFVLTYICPSPSAMLSQAYFEAVRRL